MAQENIDNNDVEIDEALIKSEKLQKEKKKLLVSLDSADYSEMKTRVAAILNLYPKTRNSDVALTIKYWEVFQPELYNAQGILPSDLFKLERLHYIVRARAKIQNEYGLFLAEDVVRRRRRVHEEDMREAVLNDVNPRKMINVFSDESGKNQRFILIASVWMLTGLSVFSLTRAIESWKKNSPWAEREIHFARFGRNEIDTLNEYLQIINENREYLSIKLIAVERARLRRPIEEVILKLHEHMLLKGIEHEVRTARVDLPREVIVTVDHEQSLDAIALEEMKNSLNHALSEQFNDDIQINRIDATSSRHSALVQLADVIAGAINRKMNHEGERNHKDDYADAIIESLNIIWSEEHVEDLDSSALFLI